MRDSKELYKKSIYILDDRSMLQKPPLLHVHVIPVKRVETSTLIVLKKQKNFKENSDSLFVREETARKKKWPRELLGARSTRLFFSWRFIYRLARRIKRKRDYLVVFFLFLVLALQRIFLTLFPDLLQHLSRILVYVQS